MPFQTSIVLPDSARAQLISPAPCPPATKPEPAPPISEMTPNSLNALLALKRRRKQEEHARYSMPPTLVEKYAPKSMANVLDNSQGVKKITDWIKAFKARSPKVERALFVHGAPGIGKTTAVTLALREAGYHVLEFNASDKRKLGSIKKYVYPHFVNGSFRDQPLAIVMDEIDGMTGQDKGGLAAVLKLIKGDLTMFRMGAGGAMHSGADITREKLAAPAKAKGAGKKAAQPEREWYAPIVCIANEAYSKKLYELRQICLEVKFSPPRSFSLMELVERVLKEQGYSHEPMVPKFIVDNVETADFRHLLVYLEQLLLELSEKDGRRFISDEQAQAFSVSTVDHNYRSIFDCTSTILRNKLSMSAALQAHSFDSEKISSMIHRNYPTHLPSVARRVADPKAVAQAEADVAEQMATLADNYASADLLSGIARGAGKFGPVHHANILWSYGSSQLLGRTPANTTRARPPPLERMDYRDWDVRKSARQLAQLPFAIKRLGNDLGLLRYKLEDKRRNSNAARKQEFLEFAETYRLSFADLEQIDTLTTFAARPPDYQLGTSAPPAVPISSADDNGDPYAIYTKVVVTDVTHDPTRFPFKAQPKFNKGTAKKPLRDQMRSLEPVAEVTF